MDDILYSTLEDAVIELNKRQKDKNLKKQVDEYLCDLDSDLLNKEPSVFISRHVNTPDYDLDFFLKLVEKTNLKPVLLEYKDDFFIAKNEDKHALGKLLFYIDTDKNGQVNMFGFKVIDFKISEGKKIKDIKTLWGESLVDFHHRILMYFFPKLKGTIFDCSEWFHKSGGNSNNYYKKFLALFIRNGILIDNFREDDIESVLVKNIVYPAFKEIREKFNLKPLICPLHKIEDENNPKWWGYPNERMNKVLELSKEYDKI